MDSVFFVGHIYLPLLVCRASHLRLKFFYDLFHSLDGLWKLDVTAKGLSVSIKCFCLLQVQWVVGCTGDVQVANPALALTLMAALRNFPEGLTNDNTRRDLPLLRRGCMTN